MPKRPHIVLTIADDQRHSALSCDQGPTADAVRTPHLDALALRGCRFTHAHHAGSPSGAICCPSRAMLHTGCGPYDLPTDMVPHDLGDAYSGPGNARTLGQSLGDVGYRTHAVGKWHNDDASFARSFQTGQAVFRSGMDDHFNLPVANWDGRAFAPCLHKGCHSTDVFSESACEFLERYAADEDGDRPFFLYVAFTAPHDPRKTHRTWHQRYPVDAIALPPNAMPEHPFDNSDMRIRDEMLTSRPRDPYQTQCELADYYAMTEHLDHGIGRIHTTLRELGLDQDTLVIHTADHGLAVGQHGLMGKQNLYDHSVRVPLLVAGPDVPAGQIASGVCYQHDLFPTLLESAELGPTDRCAFRSLWPMLHDPQARVHEQVQTYYRRTQRMVSDGRHKLIQYQSPAPAVEQAFDLQANPWELHDADAANLPQATREHWMQLLRDAWG